MSSEKRPTEYNAFRELLWEAQITRFEGDYIEVVRSSKDGLTKEEIVNRVISRVERDWGHKPMTLELDPYGALQILTDTGVFEATQEGLVKISPEAETTLQEFDGKRASGKWLPAPKWLSDTP